MGRSFQRHRPFSLDNQHNSPQSLNEQISQTNTTATSSNIQQNLQFQESRRLHIDYRTPYFSYEDTSSEVRCHRKHPMKAFADNQYNNFNNSGLHSPNE